MGAAPGERAVSFKHQFLELWRGAAAATCSSSSHGSGQRQQQQQQWSLMAPLQSPLPWMTPTVAGARLGATADSLIAGALLFATPTLSSRVGCAALRAAGRHTLPPLSRYHIAALAILATSPSPLAVGSPAKLSQNGCHPFLTCQAQLTLICKPPTLPRQGNAAMACGTCGAAGMRYSPQQAYAHNAQHVHPSTHP